ncbi:hypothetical protein [Pacificoceanicola onchidii]|uniref:hypothetical protein n=1 Tax=Pacificoceanicola onchidii TaxID=2562685 RepID=UPI0010A65566|nr:hypothetical protein [Pacificoceanicola onchidii]
MPGAQKQPTPQQRVQPMSQSGGSASSSNRKPPAIQPSRQEKDPDPTTHIAPPSIMQIKISQMLYEQASRQDESEATEDKPPESAELERQADRAPPRTETRRTEEAQDKRDPPKAQETDPALAPEPQRSTAMSGYEEAGKLVETA